MGAKLLSRIKIGQSPFHTGQGKSKKVAAARSIIIRRCAPPQLNPGAVEMLKFTGHTVSAPAVYIEINLAPIVEKNKNFPDN